MSYDEPNFESRSRPSGGQVPDSRELVAERLRARRQRVRLIRRRITATGASIFALAWGVIFVQLVSGHDPALAHGKNRASTSSDSTGSGSTTSQASSPASASPSTTSQS